MRVKNIKGKVERKSEIEQLAKKLTPHQQEVVLQTLDALLHFQSVNEISHPKTKKTKIHN